MEPTSPTPLVSVAPNAPSKIATPDFAGSAPLTHTVTVATAVVTRPNPQIEFDVESTRMLQGLTQFPRQAELDLALSTVAELTGDKLRLFRHNLKIARESVLILNASVKELEASYPSLTGSNSAAA
jgi:hypothetical protein